VAPGGGNAQQGALLRTGHDQPDDDLVARAEDVLHVGVQIGHRGHDAGQHPGDGVAAGEVADCAGVELCVGGEVVSGVVAVGRVTCGPCTRPGRRDRYDIAEPDRTGVNPSLDHFNRQVIHFASRNDMDADNVALW
jgi:hypothetical protein